MQLVPITANIMSSNPVHSKVYWIQLLKLVSDLRQVYAFLWVLRFPPLITLATKM